MVRLVTVISLVLLVGASIVVPAEGPASAEPPAPAPSPAAPEPAPPDRVPQPDRTLGSDWRRSTDRAVTTAGDETGLHVLVADRRDAYRWRAVATLSEPTIPSDQWVGQLCVTGSGRRAVVAYAPRTFTNEPVLMERGAFAAVVDLETGAVTKLRQRVTLAYFNPSCGAGETAVVSRLEQPVDDGDPARTWIGLVDAATGELGPDRRANGQVTSAVPVAGRILATKGYAVVEVGVDGALTRVAATPGQPFRLLPEGTSGLALQVARGDQVDLARLAGDQLRTVATVPAGAVKLRPGAGGAVYAVGGHASERVTGVLPPAWRVVDALPDSEFSTGGLLVVERAVTGREAAGRLAAPGTGRPLPVHIEGTLRDGSTRVEFTAVPAPAPAGRQLSPALGGSGAEQAGTAQAPDPSTVPWDPQRACAVPRNDPAIQVYQPTPAQVEWAANLAVRGQLTFQRPANWLNNGLPAYSPQGYFPSKPLSGGGHVPAQVFLGILAQESNMWQASWHVVDALAGNPLTSSGFYGIPWDDQDPTQIDWSKVDCGYGAAQVTTGMRTSDTGTVVNGVTMDYTKQKAVVLDYATNVAAGLRILQDKWNQTRDAGLIANNGDPQFIENWWFAVWAYNTGLHPNQGNGEPWGVGWSNNPASPLYPADRQMFLTEPLDVPSQGIDDEIGYDNAKHPNHWSYPERVMGFAYTSLVRYNYQSGNWEDTYFVAEDSTAVEAQPGRFTFCVPSLNQCDPAALNAPDPIEFPTHPPGPCLRDDLECWWHAPVTWEPDCPSVCGVENRRYTTVEPRPLASAIYDSRCGTTGLPAGARVIDDIDSAAPLGPQGCARAWTVGGSFGLEFETIAGPGGDEIQPGKVDFHQIGGGFGGHFWFTHSVREPGHQQLRATGRWTINPVNAWARVFVHAPDHGAHTQQAFYEITLPSGARKHRVISQHYEQHTWVDIGVFDFRGSGSPVIELSNFTQDGVGVHDIAWDAIAVQPLPAKPEHFVVALGDSYAAGEGTFNYYRGTNWYRDTPDDPGSLRNECRRSPQTWSRQATIPGAPASMGGLSDGFHANLDFHLVACAGARSHNMMATTVTFPAEPTQPDPFDRMPAGQYGELTQIDRGFLDENTTLVTLVLGGNNAGWTDVLEACILGSFQCHEDPMMDAVTANITGPVPESVALVMDQIQRVAPNARIVLMGYPKLFDSQCGDGLMTSTERIVLNDLAVTFAEHTVRDPEVYDPRSTGRSLGIDVTPTFFGPVCPLFIDVVGQCINGVRLDPPPASEGSFHPKVCGYEIYATLLQHHLGSHGYGW
jgi:hypothetical protein